jgi:glutathione reductase (NADPH)
MADFDYDLFVIGAGSGGVRAARVSAAYGAKVAIAEEYKIGGTCVIRGCVPKKMLVYGSHFAEDLHDAARYGWTLGEPSFDWATLRDNVQADVSRLEGLYTNTLDNNKVEIFRERATVTGANEITLAGGRKISAGKILIATGAWPVVPSHVPGVEHGITSNEVFHLENFPKRVVIAGAGYIANEFAGIFHALGSKVTVVNRSDQILRGYDEQIRDRLFQISSQKGIEFLFNVDFEKIDKLDDGSLCIRFKDHAQIDADLLLFAIGRSPHSKKLGLEEVGVELDEKGAIKVDDENRTNVPSIYAVGDVTNRVQLTPVAIREGQAFADTVFGNKPHKVDYACIPSAVFSNPPMAGVGLTERQAREQYGTVKTFTSDFRPMRNVLAGREERSLYKLVVHAETDVVLGIHMISPDAPEILQAAAIAVKAKLTKAQFDDTIALHPSMAEELVLMK